MPTNLEHRTTQRTAREIRRLVVNTFNSPTKRESEQARTVFLAHFAQSLYGSIHAAYKVKAERGRDELGNRWKKLAFSTVMAKLRKRKRLQQSILQSLRRSGLKGEALQTKAFELAAQLIPIGIDKGDLEKSFRPGKIHGIRYFPASRNQIAKRTPEGMQLGSKVPHATHFHRRRPIFPGPRKMRVWTLRALDAGRRALVSWLNEQL